jgi:hypothetical protein
VPEPPTHRQQVHAIEQCQRGAAVPEHVHREPWLEMSAAASVHYAASWGRALTPRSPLPPSAFPMTRSHARSPPSAEPGGLTACNQTSGPEWS